MEKRSFNKRGQVDEAARHQDDEAANDFHRRAALNKALGMTARNPYAFQLSEDELAEAEASVASGVPPLPIATATNGLRMLIDPWREEIRRQERNAIPDATPEERKARYAGGKYAEMIQV